MNAFPTLRRGSHLHPSDGMCLTEWVSVLAGEPFTDTPHCLEPTLATLARLVNDELDDTARQELVAYAPRLVGQAGAGTSASDVVAAALGYLAATPGLPHRHSARVERHRRRATRRSARLHGTSTHRLASARTWLYQRGPANAALTNAVAAVRHLPEAERSRVLIGMLEAGLDAVSCCGYVVSVSTATALRIELSL